MIKLAWKRFEQTALINLYLKLIYNKNELDDFKEINYLNFVEYNPVYLIYKLVSANPCLIVYDYSHKRICTLTAHYLSLVSEVQEKIQDLTGRPVEDFVLRYNFQKLSSELTLADYDIACAKTVWVYISSK